MGLDISNGASPSWKGVGAETLTIISPRAMPNVTDSTHKISSMAG